MKPVILYRNLGTSGDQEEIQAAEHAGFEVITNRGQIAGDQLIIPRYSAIPFYQELQEQVEYLSSKLINTIHQHRYAADLQNWVADLQDLTPLTWDRLEDLPDNMSFILKGETNSRKDRWLSLMFAEDKIKAIEIFGKLNQDSLISQQKIYIRQYVPLETFMIGVNGQPITNEYRFFIYRGQILSGGFYWSSYVDDLPEKPDPLQVPESFLKQVMSRIGNQINFVVVDVAQTAAGDWIVIEVNDGTQSGLSCNDPKILYSNLMQELEGQGHENFT